MSNYCLLAITLPIITKRFRLKRLIINCSLASWVLRNCLMLKLWIWKSSFSGIFLSLIICQAFVSLANSYKDWAAYLVMGISTKVTARNVKCNPQCQVFDTYSNIHSAMQRHDIIQNPSRWETCSGQSLSGHWKHVCMWQPGQQRATTCKSTWHHHRVGPPGPCRTAQFWVSSHSVSRPARTTNTQIWGRRFD